MSATVITNIKRGLNTHTLYWHNAGPLMQYDGEFLYIEDLNPELKTKWRMSRGEMFRLAWACLREALRARRW